MVDSVRTRGLSSAPRLRRTLDSLLVGFQVIDFDWKYVYVNPAAARHGQSTPRALLGRTMAEAYPGIENTPMFELLRQCMEHRTRHVLENLFTYPDGRSRWFDIRIEPVPEGVCVYSFDIHDRKEAQLALERRNAELEAALPTLRRLLRTAK
jgi:two-component system, sensor histidine kinase PdtaS